MDRRTANKQRQTALLRVFYMLVVMTLLIVRAGLDCRSASASRLPGVVTPPEPSVGKPPNPPSHLYPAALRLLRVAEAVLRRLGEMACELYEILKQAYALTLSVRGRVCDATRLHVRSSERLDTS